MKRVLIIEDDAIVAGIYRNKFQSLGFKVEVAQDGEKGLACILNGKPDCVLLDLMLPKLHGVEVIKKVRANPAFKFLPILVFTNAYMGNSVEDAWEAGANQVLTKSNNTPRQVADTMAEVMKSVKEQEAAAKAPAGPPAQPAYPPPPPSGYPAPQGYYPPPNYPPPVMRQRRTISSSRRPIINRPRRPPIVPGPRLPRRRCRRSRMPTRNFRRSCCARL